MKSKMQMLTEGIERSNNEDITVFKNGKNEYVVQNKGNIYNVVTKGREVVSCTCPHFTHRQIPCKHMAKVKNEFKKDINIKHFDLIG